MEFDGSELEGKGLRCLDGCAYCCLCPPEVRGADREHFLRAHPRLVEEQDGTPHIALQGGAGACSLLKDRRCLDYDRRPFHCRAFPVRVHYSYRVQALANLSCRGVAAGEGVPLNELLSSLLAGEAASELEREGTAALREWNLFQEKARKRGIYDGLEGPRASAADLLGRGTDHLEADLEEMQELAGETFGSRELTDLPVYPSPELAWWLFSIEGGSVRRSVLQEDGRRVPSGSWPLEAVPVLEMDGGGRKQFLDYLALLNRRDPLAGAAALVARLDRFEEDFEETYLDLLRDCALDLWWRASLLAFLKQESVLGPAEIREGIIFCDADFLDMSGIGGML